MPDNFGTSRDFRDGKMDHFKSSDIKRMQLPLLKKEFRVFVHQR